MKSVEDICWKGRIALVRADLNIPLDRDYEIDDDTRIVASLPTLKHILDNNGGCTVMSHLGRPDEGRKDTGLSLETVSHRLARLLSPTTVRFADLDQAARPDCGEVLVLENTRFNEGEKSCATQLCRRYAALGDVFVMDAFASAHRAEASTVGVAKHFRERLCGLLMQRELQALEQAVGSEMERPLIMVVGGAKISTKLKLLRNLLHKTDWMILGGGVANTFLAAKGYNIGKSLTETNMLNEAGTMLKEFEEKILLQHDCICAGSPRATETAVRRRHDVQPSEMILDIGPETVRSFSDTVGQAATIIWNGPLGLFERKPFSNGTRQVGMAIASSSAYSVAGGGDTLSAIRRFSLGNGISHMSTGGGAMLGYLEGKRLPGIKALEQT